MACGLLIPRPGAEPGLLAVEVQSLNHWTPREVPNLPFNLGPLLVLFLFYRIFHFDVIAFSDI